MNDAVFLPKNIPVKYRNDYKRKQQVFSSLMIQVVHILCNVSLFLFDLPYTVVYKVTPRLPQVCQVDFHSTLKFKFYEYV